MCKNNTKLFYKSGYGFQLIRYIEMSFLAGKKFLLTKIVIFSDYQKYDGHVLSRQPVLHFNVKLHIKKYVVSLYLQDSVVMKTMLVRHEVSFWNYGS